MSPLEEKIANSIKTYQKSQSDYFREHQHLRQSGVWIPFKIRNTDDIIYQAIVNEVHESSVFMEIMYINNEKLRIFVSDILLEMIDGEPVLTLGEWKELEN